ncbi:hypothetical protein PCANC_22083 [Puccinia coronata f. sp. avenae]|uniref:Reverse transcriptase Ty1/copia-type domain-containing protein n=1 Tax=Puccinia coronata f. sp. avenae TaxID=200324 RepID=A0A2N5SEW1_9BASI|nr:hypothetical protein PCANC_22083 [Puccinia coronata f. sp. avenae]
MALGHATCHCLWIRNLLYNIIGTNFPVRIFCNNQSAVKIGCEDVSNKQTHHIEREFYVTNQALFEKKTSLEWIPGKNQIADVLTKALGKLAHNSCGNQIQGGAFEIKSLAKISKSGGPLCDSITYLCHVVCAAKERSDCPSLDRSQSGVGGVGL